VVDRPPEGLRREGTHCPVCECSMRVRSAIALLCQELLGVQMTLPEFPELKGVRGIGMSDFPAVAEKLGQKFDYTNTFYHQSPRFDVTQTDARDFGRYDFIFSSEVMEHVPPPVEQAFENLFRLLKPDGLLIMTTPYNLGGKTREHFPELHHYSLASVDGKTVLVNRRRDGSLEIFENLEFHGGPGSTIEMRVFTEECLRENLIQAGFSSVRFSYDNVPEFGIEHAENWSLPIVARKGDFHPPTSELALEYREAYRHAAKVKAELKHVEGEYERFVAHHNKWYKDLNILLAERQEWGSKLDHDLAERTAWAQNLDQEIAELRRQFERETSRLRQHLETAQAEQARLNGRLWTRIGRKIRAL
jgi:SAM-dependent methyltransferase